MRKRIFLIITLILSSAAAAFGQTDTPETALQYYLKAKGAQNGLRYEEAIGYYEKSAELWLREDNKNNYAVTLNELGFLHYNLGNYSAALEYFEKACSVHEETGNTKEQITCLNNIASIELSRGNYASAIDAFKRNLALLEKEGNEKDTSLVFNNLGEAYRNMGRYQEAFDYFEKALAIDRKYGRTEKIPTRLNNLGVVCMHWGRYDEAVAYFKQVLSIFQAAGLDEAAATIYSNLGEVYKAWGKPDQAIEYLELALTLDEKTGKKANSATTLNNLAGVYKTIGNYDKAVELFQRALELDRSMGRQDAIAEDYNDIAGVYIEWGRYGDAVEYYQHALEIVNRIGNKAGTASILNGIGVVYKVWGRFDKSVEYIEQALSIAEEIGNKRNISIFLGNMGIVYSEWGKYDVALDYFQRTYMLSREMGDGAGIATALNNIGTMYDAQEKYDEAVDYFNQAFDLFMQIGAKGDAATLLNNTGSVYYTRGNYKKAVEYYERAIAIYFETGRQDGLSDLINNLGNVYGRWNRYDRAVEHFQWALNMDTQQGNQAGIARDLTNLGIVYYSAGELDRAASFFSRAGELIKLLRRTAPGAIKRDYLAAQIDAYRFLVSTHIRSHDPVSAFNTAETSSAQYLAEQMSQKVNESEMKPVVIREYAKRMDEGTGVITFTNVGWSGMIALLFADRDSVLGEEIPLNDFISSLTVEYSDNIDETVRGLRAVMVHDKKEEPQAVVTESADLSGRFMEIITYYRYLLSKQMMSARERTACRDIGRELYNLLFHTIEDQIADKKELLIIPGGILAFVPFETLIMPDGRYMAEEYTITYTQSLAVSELISKRNYPGDRKSLLAFGGAVYNEPTYDLALVESEQQLAAVEKNILLAMTRGEGTGETYYQLGYGDWDNLPGTLTEVRAIGQVVSGAEVITGHMVDEAGIKELSRTGRLDDYRVIHFATHGLAVPEIPELSAIVLSLSNKEENKPEDGYLRMQEIVELDLQADFVNLSACETGLGKLYGGEGVVGLTQAFLVAGANGLCVSLWQVADDSTMEFMTGLYRLVETKGLSYSDAMAEMKRQFIGGKYAAPFHWAPFVHYGQ